LRAGHPSEHGKKSVNGRNGTIANGDAGPIGRYKGDQ
jgi:hypothetical protein